MSNALKSRLLSALKGPLFFPAIVYLFSGLLLMSSFQSFMYKDEISYVTIAETYAKGDVGMAPNAYWAPLLSWLLAGLLILGLEAVLASKLLSLIIGMATLFAASHLCDVFEIRRGLKIVLLLTLVPFLLYSSLIFFTPDLLLTCLLTFYFSVLLRGDYSNHRYAGVWCGALGALAFFAKGYSLPFFLLHFPLLNLAHYLSAKEARARRMVWRHCAFGLLVFTGMLVIWAYVLYGKHHEVTLGMTGKYNHAIKGPDALDRPIFHIGFVRPPDSATVSIWEEPYHFYSLPRALSCCLKPWGPLDSRRAFKHQVKLTIQNVASTISAYMSFSMLSLMIIISSLALCIAPPPNVDSSTRMRVALGVATLAIYPAGYTLVYSEERYLWPMQILTFVLGGFLLQLLFRTPLFSSWVWKLSAVTLVSASFLILPLDQLWRRASAGRTTDTFGRLLAAEQLSGSRIASNTDYDAGVCVAYYLRAQYYGMARPNISTEDLVGELRQTGVNHYLFWDAPPIDFPGLEMIRKLQAGGRSLTLYSVNR